MEFCIGTLAKVDQVHLVRRAEDVGATLFAVGEGALLFSDPYPFLALAARETSRIKLGTWVTNPLTRTTPVTANSIATLNALAPGRVLCGMGAANNAMRSMGRDVATMAELDHAFTVVRGLLAGDRVVHSLQGEDREVEFLDAEGHWYSFKEPVEMWMAAGGAKALTLAARHADRVTYCLGPNPDVIRLIRRLLDKAVADAGRPPGSVKLVSNTWSTGSVPVSPGRAASTTASDPSDQLVLGQCWSVEPARRRAGRRHRGCAVNTAAVAYLGDPTAPDQSHYLDVWAKYLGGLDSVHKPIITKQLVDYWSITGSPVQMREQAQTMFDAGVDMIGSCSRTRSQLSATWPTSARPCSSTADAIVRSRCAPLDSWCCRIDWHTPRASSREGFQALLTYPWVS